MRRSCHPSRRFSYELAGPLVVSAPRSADLQLLRRDADVDLHDAVNDSHRIRIDREHRGKRAHLASQEVEPRPVARAFDQAILELALAEHAAVVSAHVVDRAPRVVVAVAESETLVAACTTFTSPIRTSSSRATGTNSLKRGRPSPRCCRCVAARSSIP